MENSLFEKYMKRDKPLTLEEVKGMRANTAQWRQLYLKMDNEALEHITHVHLNNIFPTSQYSYDYSLVNVLVPELLKRLNGKLTKTNDRE